MPISPRTLSTTNIQRLIQTHKQWLESWKFTCLMARKQNLHTVLLCKDSEYVISRRRKHGWRWVSRGTGTIGGSVVVHIFHVELGWKSQAVPVGGGSGDLPRRKSSPSCVWIGCYCFSKCITFIWSSKFVEVFKKLLLSLLANERNRGQGLLVIFGQKSIPGFLKLPSILYFFPFYFLDLCQGQ